MDEDGDDPHLPPDQIEKTVEKIIAYTRLEKDYRGFVDQKGWAHALAHTADCLGSCTRHPRITPTQRESILEAIFRLATRPAPFLHHEDDRLAYAVLRLAQKDKADQLNWSRWLAQFPITSGTISEVIGSQNMQHVLRAFYFMLIWELPSWPHTDAVLSQIKHLHAFYRYGTLPLSD